MQTTDETAARQILSEEGYSRTSKSRLKTKPGTLENVKPLAPTAAEALNKDWSLVRLT